MPKTSIYNLLLEMIKHEENFGTYWIYLALKKGYLQKLALPIPSIYYFSE